MGLKKHLFRLFKLFFVINCIVDLVSSGRSLAKLTTKHQDDSNQIGRIPIGVVYDQNTTDLKNALILAMEYSEKYNKNICQVFVDIINTADAFKLSRLVCNQFARGVHSLIAAVHPDSFSTFYTYANTFHMPFVTPFFLEKVPRTTSSNPDFALSLLPDYHQAILSTVTYLGWANVIYLYDSNDGMLRLQQLFRSLIPGRQPFFRIANVKQITTAKDIITYLRQVEKSNRWNEIYIILDCSTEIAKETITLHDLDVNIGQSKYNYLFTGFVLDEYWEKELFELNSIHIIGFKLVDMSRKFVRDFLDFSKKDFVEAKDALMFDAALTVIEAFQRLAATKPQIIKDLMNSTHSSNRLDCDEYIAKPLKYGKEIANIIRATQIEGLSGKIRFDESGLRINFSLIVVQNSPPEGGVTKIGTWYDDKGLQPLFKNNLSDVLGKYDRSKTYIVVSIEEPPYLTISRSANFRKGDISIVFGGFCADLAEMIANILHIKIQIRLSKDGKYGHVNPNNIAGWDGMVGELVRKEIDMVIAPLVVTKEREAVVDFSHPFLSFNSITPVAKDKNLIFSFLKPLSKETWYVLAISVLLVSITLFLVSRFSPAEWRVADDVDTDQSANSTEITDTGSSITNEFTFFNSLWYTVCSIMQQYSGIVPRSISARIVSVVWWFFTIIIISSYTAYLTSQLTLNSLESPQLPVYNKLAYCPEDVHTEKMRQHVFDYVKYEHMDSTSKAFKPRPQGNFKLDYTNRDCVMLLNVMEPGIKDFAVAFPKRSKLRTGVNLALTELRQKGELSVLMRKHFHNYGCGMPPPATHGKSEMSLGDNVGVFYFLLGGIGVGIAVALFDFYAYRRLQAANANISIRAALCANTRRRANEENAPRRSRRRQRNQECRCGRIGMAPESSAGPLRSQIMPDEPMNRSLSRDLMSQQSQESLELTTQSYFAPTNQTGHEESLTQI